MMHLDLASILNLVSTTAIVGALVFTALQVRAANNARRDQGAVVIIQTTQDSKWIEALNLVSTLPEGATVEYIREKGEAMERALFELSIRLEPVGYMVFCRIITLTAVDDLIGGVVMVIWSRAKEWTEKYRKSSNNPKFNEWVEWLSDRILERRKGLPPEPAPRQYRNWSERQMYRAVGFDIGDTLLYYADTPLDWSSHYPDALSAVARVCDIAPDNRQINAACDVLQHYNARIRPRAEEVSADEIFLHILSAWSLPANEHLKTAVDAFFMFFQQRMCAFPETVSVLRTLRSSGLRVGALTDVPYGMPQRFVDRDLERAHLAALLDAVVTSAMAGCRKPAIDGYLLLASRLGVEPDEMLYVGNEPKDVLGAQQARIRSAFLCRTGEAVDHGQNYTISSLRTVLDICGLRSDGDAVSTGSRP